MKMEENDEEEYRLMLNELAKILQESLKIAESKWDAVSLLNSAVHFSIKGQKIKTPLLPCTQKQIGLAQSMSNSSASEEIERLFESKKSFKGFMAQAELLLENKMCLQSLEYFSK